MNENRMKQIITLFLVILLFLTSSVPSFTASKNNSMPSQSETHKSITELVLDLKIRLCMRIINMPSLTMCAIKNESIVWSRAYGTSKILQREKATLDTIYVIGSISKTVTATAILQLYEKGFFNLDDNINDYLPFEITNPNHPNINITFRMLLAHQSSLGDTLFDIIYYLPLLDNSSQWIQERLIPGAKHYRESYWRDYEPGENIGYSNMGFIIASILIEEISGKSFEQYCQDNIFQPLAMTNTSFQPGNLDKDKFAIPTFPFFGFYIPMFHYDTKCVSPCGGLRTNIEDLSHFLMVHMHNGTWNNVSILNTSTVELMHSVQYPNASQPFYQGYIQHGLGWSNIEIEGEEWEGYNGGAVGYVCNMVIHKSDGIAVILLSNGHFFRKKIVLNEIRIKYFNQLGEILIQQASN